MDSSAALKQESADVLEFPGSDSPQGLLRAARRAWKDRLKAESEVKRLDSYQYMNRSMRKDRGEAVVRMMRAEQTLTQILNQA